MAPRKRISKQTSLKKILTRPSGGGVKKRGEYVTNVVRAQPSRHRASPQMSPKMIAAVNDLVELSSYLTENVTGFFFARSREEMHQRVKNIAMDTASLASAIIRIESLGEPVPNMIFADHGRPLHVLQSNKALNAAIKEHVTTLMNNYTAMITADPKASVEFDMSLDELYRIPHSHLQYVTKRLPEVLHASNRMSFGSLRFAKAVLEMAYTWVAKHTSTKVQKYSGEAFPKTMRQIIASRGLRK